MLLYFDYKHERGLICISVSLGIATEIPVGIKAELPGKIFIGDFMNAIKSMPEDPGVL